MAAKDNIPFNTICNSEDIRLGLYARGFRDIPKSPEGIRLKVKAHYIFVVGGYRKEFGEIRKQGRKISITFDEWTSTRNRRYMNVNAHDGQRTWNLGLKRIVGSMDAEKCVKLLEEILSEYGLSLTEDVVAATTDGASVMKKVGRLIPGDHQVCLAHGIHLAVTSVLYSRNEPTYNQRELSGEDSNDADSDSSTDDEDDGEFVLEDAECDEAELRPEYHATIKKLRGIVRIFRKSPVKNDDLLQKYVKQEFGKEMPLVIDVNTRWNSLCDMLQRFYVVRNAVQKAMIDLKGQVKLNMTDNEMDLVREIINALEPINAAVEQLCRKDCSLYEADVALHFMLEQLSCQETAIANELFEALKQRVAERRFGYADLFAFLKNTAVKTSISNDFGIFFKTPKTTLIKQAAEILKRLNGVETDEPMDSTEAPTADGVDAGEYEALALTMKQKFERRMQQSKVSESVPVSSITAPGFVKIVRQEFTYYDSEKLKGKYLSMLHDSLATVRPTSVDSERAFSVSGSFATKIRSRMSDETLSMLCVLKAYFKDKDKPQDKC